jgi:arylsulfatase A-like enzyme
MAAVARPNVILIMSDDQGYGDLSLHGNPHLKTPHIDRIAREGAQFTQFQVCPVCSPTRASLMTGRYNYRTGVVDTFLGRSMMDPREVTAAEMFRAAGYRTGIFGKWHLGDSFPMRAHDQGFAEALVHGGGGLTQPADPPPGNTYFDPVLLRNGKPEKTRGYCTNIFFDEALRFIDRAAGKPFFLYIPTNAPHTPLQVDGKYVAPFQAAGLDDTTAKVYGMCVNLDENVGRLLAHLDEKKLAAETILIFLTDNGPQQRRYNAGMRGLKGTPYQGGIRVPFFLRYPARVAAGGKMEQIAAHIDVLPTLLDACGVPNKTGARFDGVSHWAALTGGAAAGGDRVIHTQWHRGDEPVLFRSHAARTQKWKLVNGVELYDMESDPGESKNVAAAHPDVVARLRAATEAWFRDVASTRGGYAPPRIFIGAREENPVLLTRQDWRGEKGGWDPSSIGHWEVDVRHRGPYTVRLLFAPAANAGTARFRLGPVTRESGIAAGQQSCEWHGVQFPAGPGRVAPVLEFGNSQAGVLYVEIRK